jgi:hypothetical protein
MDRLMMSITPSGISLLGLSKQELNMQEPLVLEGATKSHWIEANNLPGIPKVLLSVYAEDNDKETDWLWVCLDNHSLDWEHVKTLISTVRARVARAVILFWASKSDDASMVSYWVSWCNGRDELGIGFHVVSAEQHEGILCERFHRYLNKVQRLQGIGYEGILPLDDEHVFCFVCLEWISD